MCMLVLFLLKFHTISCFEQWLLVRDVHQPHPPRRCRFRRRRRCVECVLSRRRLIDESFALSNVWNVMGYATTACRKVVIA